jgi:hypothetical protein
MLALPAKAVLTKTKVRTAETNLAAKATKI